MQNNTLEHVVKNLLSFLQKNNQTISFAESCTGGRMAASLTAIPGASSVFHGSIVAYDNDIKHKWLGVSLKTLQTHGAVSKECVSQMLDGIVKMSSSDYAIAVSGIAGPGGGTPSKPVGTVYIGLLTPYEKTIHHCLFEGDRHAIQHASVVFAYEKLAQMIHL